MGKKGEKMKAIILCGGEGTRLRPYTYNAPKPMLKLGNRPILEYVLLNLKRNGFKDIILTAGYLSEQIKDYFGDGSDFGVNIDYYIEKEKLNTAGSVLQARKVIDDTFFVGMGDQVTGINIKEMLRFHKNKNNIATLGLKMQSIPYEYGIVEMDLNNDINNFKEKPALTSFINSGMYFFEPEIFDYIKPKEDFAKDVFPRLLDKGKKISGYKFNEFWADIGRVHDYETMNDSMSVIELSMSLNSDK